MKTYIILTAFCFIFLSSCEEGVVCTMEFATITINIVDSLDNPVVLDDYYVQNNSTNEIIRWMNNDNFRDSMLVARGDYILVTDAERAWTNKNNLSVTFFGFIDSVNVIKENYIVTDDECHIGLVKGRTKIIYNP